MSEELEPCPFCGGKAETRLASTCIAVVCVDCDANMEAQKPPSPRYVDPLVARWNRRARSARIEELEGLLKEARDWLECVPRSEEGAIFAFGVRKRIDAALNGGRDGS